MRSSALRRRPRPTPGRRPTGPRQRARWRPTRSSRGRRSAARPDAVRFDAVSDERPHEGQVPSRRLLVVHAHPDDETIGTGATMARYVAEGAGVTLLTCTLGEEGEVLVPELAELAAPAGDQLGGYRIGELASAMRH